MKIDLLIQLENEQRITGTSPCVISIKGTGLIP